MIASAKYEYYLTTLHVSHEQFSWLTFEEMLLMILRLQSNSLVRRTFRGVGLSEMRENHLLIIPAVLAV